MVIPAKPEEKDPLITPHGNWLQEQSIKSLRSAFYEAKSEDQFGAFSLRTLARPKPEEMIYVHSKVMIVDDEFAIIGSANANPRSFRLDSEANVAWRDRSSVTVFRRRLWSKLLGNPKGLQSWKPEEFVDRWREIAKANEAGLKAGKSKGKRPGPAQGHVVSYPGIMNARRNIVVPEIIVDLHSSEPVDERPV